jgi:hypothetical protein
MSTSIRRSSRRAAAKCATNASVDDGLIPNHSEVRPSLAPTYSRYSMHVQE